MSFPKVGQREISGFLDTLKILEYVAKNGPQTSQNILDKFGVSAKPSLNNLIEQNYVLQKGDIIELTPEGNSMYQAFC